MDRETELAARLQREALAANYVMFRDERTAKPWLGHYDTTLKRWVLVTPTAGSIALTVEQLLAFGFTYYLRVGLEGLEPAA